MDWTTPLRSLQADFIQRLKSGRLLNSEIVGTHSELTVISGDRLDQLRDFCWEMAEKYKRNSRVRDVFINNMKGKLGEEVVKARLGDLVTEVDYEKRMGGDGKVDFILTSDPNIGVQVKARHGNVDTVQWSISREEVQKNTVLVCVLIQEEVSEAQSKYHLVLAGFLPTTIIDKRKNKSFFRINELLYGGNIRDCLENQVDYMHLAKESYQKGNYTEALAYCDKALRSKSDNTDTYYNQGFTYKLMENYLEATESFSWAISMNPSNADAYYERGFAFSKIGDFQKAIDDFDKAIKINPDYSDAYFERALIYTIVIKDYRKAIEDFTRVVETNPNNSIAHCNRGFTYMLLKEYQKAIEDFTKTAEIEPNSCEAYEQRGFAHRAVRNYQQAVADYTKAIDLNPEQADLYYQRALTLRLMKDYQQTIRDSTRVLKINPEYTDAYCLRGVAHFQLEHYGQAIKDYQKAVVLYQQQDNLKGYQQALQSLENVKSFF